MDGSIKYRKSLLNSTANISLVRRLNNVTRKEVSGEIKAIREGNGRAGFSVSQDGKLLAGGREVVALEDRDDVIARMSDKVGDIGLARLHSALSRKYANISMAKVRYFYNNSEIAQRYRPVQERNIVRPVTSKLPLRHLQIDLIDMSNQKSTDGMNWIFTCIDVMSKFCIAIPLPNKYASTTAQAMRSIIRALSLDVTGHVIQADNGTEWKGEFTELIEETGILKLVYSKTYKSTSNAQVERMNRTIRTLLSRHAAKTGNKRGWSAALPEVLRHYNGTKHGTTGVEPGLARHAMNDPELLLYIQQKNERAAKKSMGIDGSLLEPGAKVRVALTAISSEARKDKKQEFAGRKSSELPNYTKAIFTIKSRSKGTPLQFPQYRLVEFGNKAIFWRYELMPVSESRLRLDMAKPKGTGTFARLEEEAVEQLTEKAAEASTDKPATADARFVGASVAKYFSDKGVPVYGTVIGHVAGKTDDGDGERWVVQYEGGQVKELIEPQELLDILVSDDEVSAKKKADADEKKAEAKAKKAEKEQAKKKKQQTELESDPLLGRKIREFVQLSDDPEDEVEVTGTVVRVFKKKSGKSKGQRMYVIEYDDEDLNVELPNITETAAGVRKMLID